jgi:histone H3/H4
VGEATFSGGNAFVVSVTDIDTEMDHEYAKELSKQAIAKAAVAIGFERADEIAIDALADVLRNYISTIAVMTTNQAEASGRTVPGLHDAIKALDLMV